MKKVGDYKGIEVYTDPNVPPGTMYMINEKQVHTEFAKLDGIVDDGTETTNVDHIYRTTYASDHKTHSCMLFGSWCWQQLFTHPVQAIRQWRASRRQRSRK